jgi:RNA polymerase sigma-70 factor (ECF subfamily)
LRVHRLERSSGDAAPSPEDAAETTESRAALLEAVNRLGTTDRLVIACRHLLLLSEKETADVLGWPRGTVKSRLSRAMSRLRAEMEQSHE